MAESDIKVIDTQNGSKDVHNINNTEEQTKEVKLDRKMEDTKEKNYDSTISLKSFDMVDDNKKDPSKIDNDMKTSRNQYYSEDIQEEVSTPKCCNCISEVSEFLPWFCINIGRWCSNRFKRNCCCCCNKKNGKRKHGNFDEDNEVDWDGNDGDLTRYSLPVRTVDDDSTVDDGIKIKFHRNEGFDGDDDIRIESVDFKNCDSANKGVYDMSKESDHDSKTVTHDDNHHRNSHKHSEVHSNLHGISRHDHNNALNRSDRDIVMGNGSDLDSKTVTHEDNHHRNSHRHSDVPSHSYGISRHEQHYDFNKYDNVNKGDTHMSKGSYHDTKTVTHDNHQRYNYWHSDEPPTLHGISSHDQPYDFNRSDNVHKGDTHMSKGSYHDTNTVTPDDNYHSHSHGHSFEHSSSHHGISSDSHVSNDYTTHSYTDTGFSGGDVGGCDTGGSSDW